MLKLITNDGDETKVACTTYLTRNDLLKFQQEDTIFVEFIGTKELFMQRWIDFLKKTTLIMGVKFHDNKLVISHKNMTSSEILYYISLVRLAQEKPKLVDQCYRIYDNTSLSRTSSVLVAHMYDLGPSNSLIRYNKCSNHTFIPWNWNVSNSLYKELREMLSNRFNELPYHKQKVRPRIVTRFSSYTTQWPETMDIKTAKYVFGKGRKP